MKFRNMTPHQFAGPSPSAVQPMSQQPHTSTPSSDEPALLIGRPGASASPSPGHVGPGGPGFVDSHSQHAISDGQQIAVHRHLLSLIENTGWSMVQNNGQRKFGPSNNWKGPAPGRGCEVFIGRIPRDMFEHELFPILERAGRLYEIRLMMDFSGTNRGFGFAQYASPEEADRAVAMLNGTEVRPGRFLGVVKSVDNRRLFVGGLPKDKTQEDVKNELSKLVSGIVQVILYSSVVDKTKNRGFAFVEFESHRVAAIARRRLMPGNVFLWDHELAVDWAEPEPEVPSEIMAKVRVLYMRNIMLSTSEEQIRRTIELYVPPHTIEKVKKLKDFAFLHFTERRYAEEARKELDGMEIDGSMVAVVWAKPPELAQRRQLEAFSGEMMKTNEPGGRVFLRGAGGLRKLTSSKMSPEMRFDPLNPLGQHIAYQVPYQYVQTNTTNYQVTLPVSPPNNVVSGQACGSVWEAQENASGMALRVLYQVYVGPPPFPVVPVAPAGIQETPAQLQPCNSCPSPPVIYAPPPYVCNIDNCNQ